MHNSEPRPGVDGGAGPERFEQLFRRHHAAVVAYVRRRAPDEIVDDVVGETFLVAWRRLDGLPEHELPWLLGVARNVLGTQRRSALRRRALTARLGSLRATEPDQGAPPPGAASEGDDRLRAALQRLSPKDREALTLIAWDGLRPHEAAMALGESPETFRVRLHRARRRLRRLLDHGSVAARPSAGHTLQIEEVTHD